jgi:hypothetical protein
MYRSREIEPAFWKRIELSSQTALKQLHRILQIAMGWYRTAEIGI